MGCQYSVFFISCITYATSGRVPVIEYFGREAEERAEQIGAAPHSAGRPRHIGATSAALAGRPNR